MDLMGQFDCKADAKGRVTLPNALKNQLMPMIEQDFVIKRAVFQDCLELFPKSEFDVLMKQVRAEKNISRDYDLFFRKFTAGMKIDVKVDSETGRVQIPRNLIEFANIEKEVVLNCADDRVEIWDKAKYEAVLQESEKVYPDVAEKIFNKKGGSADAVSNG
ncbi:MAG: division/cell wall cluster transcriptional repressor MraZ [Croceitalea sp.]|nr:division/cell wall cluster transcriptional repressor MraZ [Croceitalea sp.]MBT8237340.1 division/cell wall cluster transcriptional repressor MraZ [Croceitalea sp.]NNL08093.1 division/cell wall cluster transcriptional repressor MraZ [Croceitalea sp.]NNM19547.1 division/cell wall cluster transcriptional repressor MraZ [Croceitalea sp.]